jgi:hypothetical protein
MLNIKSLVAAAVLTSLAALSFAQTPAAVKVAPASANATTPAIAAPDAAATAKPATKNVKSVKTVKKVKHVKAKKTTAVKPTVAASK